MLPRLAPALVLACLIGCSNGDIKKINLDGKVTYKGKPLQSGVVKVAGPNGFYTAASVMADGTFTVTDVIPGELKVGIMEAPQSAGSSDGKAPTGPKVTPLNIPEKYREPETSGLVYPVTESTTRLDVTIE